MALNGNIERMGVMNKIILVGNVCNEIEIRYTSNNTPIATFTIAVNRNHTKEDGTKETDFINIVVWNKRAENVKNYLDKGSKVGISGRLQVRKYQNERGENRYVTEVVADEVEFLNSKKSEEKTVSTKNDQKSEERLNSNKPYEDFAREHQEELSYVDDDDNSLPF